MERTITFRNSKFSWTGVPIIASNMDTVGTFEMAVTLAKVGPSDSDSAWGLRLRAAPLYCRAPYPRGHLLVVLL